MAYDIGPKVGIEGMADFKKQLRDIDSEMKLNASEMKKVTATYDENDKSMDALTSRSKALEKQLETQKSKVDTLKKAVQESSTATGENSIQTQGWQTKLNNAEAEVIKLNKSIESNAVEMQNAAKETDALGQQQDKTKGKTMGLGDAVGGLTGKLGIDLPEGAKESLNSLGGLDGGMLMVVSTSAALAAGIYKVIDALADMTVQSAAMADDILTQSSVTGLSTDTLQEMEYAAGLVDVSVENITGSMTKNIRSMRSARDGTKETAESYEKLGVSITDSNGSLRDSETVFWEVVDALGNMTNETERDALAMSIMGKSAQDLNPLIEAGSGRMAELAAEAHNVGYVMSEETLGTLGLLDDQMQRLDKSTEATKNQLSTEFAPALTKLMETGELLFKTIGDAAEKSGIIDVLTSMLSLVTSISPAVEEILGILGPGIGTVLMPLALVLSLIADALNIVSSAIALIIEGAKVLTGSGSIDKLNRFAQNITDILEGGGATGTFLGNQIQKMLGDSATSNHRGAVSQTAIKYDELSISRGGAGRIAISTNASGTDYWPGGLTWVGEKGPELLNLPTGSQIFSNEDSRQMAAAVSRLAQQGGTSYSSVSGDTYINYEGDNNYITLDPKNVKEFNDIVNMAKRARQDGRAR